MKIPALYARSVPTVSFELFPPKTPADEEVLFRQTVPALQQLAPSFCSVTWGAGGSTRDATLRIVGRLRRDFGLETMSHLTCVGATRQMIAQVLDAAAADGVENLLALRGDPPKGQSEFRAVEGGFSYAVDLVRFIRERSTQLAYPFAVGVAGYPEGHIECRDKRLDWDRTVEKVAAGAEFVVTQLFYDAEDFFLFHDYMRRRGVTVPIVPGILPFLSTAQIKRFTSLCGSKIPDGLRSRLEAHASDDETVRKIGVEVCTDLAARLLDFGVAGLHFYCLNRVASISEIFANLGGKLTAPRPAATSPAREAAA